METMNGNRAPEETGIGNAQGGSEARPRQEGSLGEQVRAKIEVPPELREAYERIILAGMKVMYSEETNQMAMEALQGDGPVEQRLAQGIRDLMVILWQESNQSLPPQLILPAAVELLSDAADFLNQSGADRVDMAQLGEAMRLMIGMILETFGVTPENVRAGAEQQWGGRPGAGQAPAGGQPAPQGSGIISGAMRNA
jgi:hypothetical protein